MRDYSSWHPDHRPVAQLWAHCSNPEHVLVGLAAWGITAAGRISIIEGIGIDQHHVGGWQPETDEEMEAVREVAGWISREPDQPVAEPHWLLNVRCQREGCGYYVPLSDSGRMETVHEVLRAMSDLRCEHLFVELNEMFRQTQGHGAPRRFVRAQMGT